MKKNQLLKFSILFLIVLLFINGDILSGKGVEKIKIRFIDYFFENASPLSWKIQGDTIIKISLPADYERESLNRQTDHWYFKLEADKGTNVKLILSKMMADVYNGKEATSWWNFKNDISCYISYDGKSWEAIKTSRLPGMELLVQFTMKGESVYVVRMPPYTVTDLENLKTRIARNKLVKIYNIGMTVEKRPLEIIQLGDQDAPNSFLIRARAHQWEAGGNWVVEGLINEFLKQDSKKWKETFCVYIMPMANKDGVARGMTRFNLSGKDLNRNWDKESDSLICPEKFALEKFIQDLIKKGRKPCLGIDLHNDDAGGLHLSRFTKVNKMIMTNMKSLESLMRKYTSFSENISYSSSEVVTFACGMYQRYGIEAVIYELNANWMGGLGKIPSEYDWMEIGKNLNTVFYEYAQQLK